MSKSLKQIRATLIPKEVIEQKIFLLRGHKVMFDKDLAALYVVGTRDLNKAVTRNLDHFPGDFMFQLTPNEFKDLMFHFGTSSWGGARKRPRAFTEQGVAMLSSVLRSKRAVRVNVEIMRAFVRLRQWLLTHEELAKKLDALEKKYDTQFKVVFDAIRRLTAPPDPPRHRIGFHSEEYTKVTGVTFLFFCFFGLVLPQHGNDVSKVSKRTTQEQICSVDYVR